MRFLAKLATKRSLVIIAAVYVVFWFSGNVAVTYTQDCARSHTESYYNRSTEMEEEGFVCDRWAVNGRRWTALDPFRALWTVVLRPW